MCDIVVCILLLYDVVVVVVVVYGNLMNMCVRYACRVYMDTVCSDIHSLSRVNTVKHTTHNHGH